LAYRLGPIRYDYREPSDSTDPSIVAADPVKACTHMSHI
jgi:hypothetical protein